MSATVSEARSSGQAVQTNGQSNLPAGKIVELQQLVLASHTADAATKLQQLGAPYGIDKRQADTLRAIANDGRPYANQRAAVYLQLLGAGCLTYLPETDTNGPRQSAAANRTS